MPKAKKSSFASHQKGVKTRLLLVAVFLSLLGTGLLVRLFHLQIVQHESLLEKSEKQYHSSIKTYWGRGNIYDRNKNMLATNIQLESVYVNPSGIEDKKLTARHLASALGLSQANVLKKISYKKHFVWIKRKCTLKEIEELKARFLPGVGFVEEHKRFYPKRELASHALGFVGLDNQGLAGLEHYYHSMLKGTTSLMVMEKDARGRRIKLLSDPDQGKAKNSGLLLTVDEVIQFTAEHYLKKQVEKTRAKHGIVIVMAPHTGEIYAMATVPPFNPNNYSRYASKTWTNHAVSSAYEPGSILKPILAAAALDSGRVTLNDIFFCENGKFKIGKTFIGEAANHKFGWLTLQDIIAKSSNIGAIKVAEKVGSSTYFHYLKQFGFGSKLGIDLPGEARGKLRELSDWSRLSLASLSFGHEISATPLQMITALSVIANGGNLMRPYITKAILQNDEPVKVFKPVRVRRVISEKTSRQMIDILKRTVEQGTGKNARLEGLDVAGKTGTAQKLDPATHTYSNTKYLSSFIGFVPAHAPKLAILVMLDEPMESYYGGVVAAPVFRDIARDTLRYLNVPSRMERVFILDRA